jgi:hypothetical protein
MRKDRREDRDMQSSRDVNGLIWVRLALLFFFKLTIISSRNDSESRLFLEWYMFNFQEWYIKMSGDIVSLSSRRPSVSLTQQTY